MLETMKDWGWIGSCGEEMQSIWKFAKLYFLISLRKQILVILDQMLYSIVLALKLQVQ